MNLYGWYSWPSIFLGFIGGYLLDNIFGLRFGAALACLFVVIGQVFLSLGNAFEIFNTIAYISDRDVPNQWLKSYEGSFLGIIELCYFGRFIFGCGGETLSVAQKGFIAQWFDQKSLNFVLGLQLSFARIGMFILTETVSICFCSNRTELIRNTISHLFQRQQQIWISWSQFMIFVRRLWFRERTHLAWHF